MHTYAVLPHIKEMYEYFFFIRIFLSYKNDLFFKKGRAISQVFMGVMVIQLRVNVQHYVETFFLPLEKLNK